MAATTTTLPAPFAWSGEHVAVDLAHGVRVLFTTRRGGVSQPPFDSLNLGIFTDDDAAAVEENRRRALALTGAERFAYGRQVHGAIVLRDTDPGADADGQVTTGSGVAAMALTADCMAIALAAPGALGMVHAGWRGLADGVIEEGLRVAGGVEAAAIGPCARGCCYEVGDEVRAAFGTNGRTVDLKAIARDRLHDAGVETVHDCGLCTMHDPARFFSHRRDGGVTGRQAGVAWRS